MSIFDQFLNTSGEAGGVPLVDRANPANWTRLGQTIVAATVATMSLAAQTVTDGIYDAWTNMLTGVTEFVAGSDAPSGIWDPVLRDAASAPGLFRTVANEWTRIAAAVWSGVLSGVPPLLQLPTAILLILATYWIVSQGFEYVREEVL